MSKVSFYDIKLNDNYVFKELENAQELDELIKSSKNLVLDVYADWCSPCKYIAPKFEKLSNDKKYSKVQFAKINLSNLSPNQLLYSKITALPAFLFFKNSEYLGKENGANIDNIKTAINAYLLKSDD